MENQSLYSILYIFLDWHPARIKTFADLIWAVIKSRTVKLKELAVYVESKGGLRAKISKIERLFLKQDINLVCFGKIMLKLLNSEGKLKLAIDRTNWQFGKKNLNFFVAAVIYGNISVPIAWLLLDKKGNSATDERKKLIEQILKILPKERIEIILGDREFVGEEWLEYLNSEELPFAIRVKKNERIKHKNGGKMQLGRFFSDMQVGAIKSVEAKFYDSEILVKITCLQLEREQLFIVSNAVVGDDALILYKQRWSIERAFKSLKTAGFNLEDTHIIDLKKLEKLFAVVSLALAICVIAGEIKNNIKTIKIKKHGYKVVSLFTYGFDWLKDYFCNMQNMALNMMFKRLRERIMSAFQISVG